MLSLSSEEIRDFMRSRGESFVTDSTNADTSYTRNKIRNELLPWVTENINSRAAEHILAVSEFAAKSGCVFRGGSGAGLKGK